MSDLPIIIEEQVLGTALTGHLRLACLSPSTIKRARQREVKDLLHALKTMSLVPQEWKYVAVGLGMNSDGTPVLICTHTPSSSAAIFHT